MAMIQPTKNNDERCKECDSRNLVVIEHVGGKKYRCNDCGHLGTIF